MSETGRAAPLDPDWQPGAPPGLEPGAVHVVRAALDVSDAAAAELAGLLSPEERARADRFQVAAAARRFTVARALLRRLLGGYLDTPPDGLRFEYGDDGKPALAGAPGLHFNVSHSAELALFAFARHGPVGVDLERVRPVEVASIARRFFTAAEAHALGAVPQEARAPLFFRYWTRKEAWAKAHGLGLWQALRLDARGLERAHGPAAQVGRWTLWELVPAAGCVAAVVARGGALGCFAPPGPGG